jgi:hypothetical protein
VTDETTPTLPRDFTLTEVADALRVSTRWLRDKIKADKLPHGLRGHKIVFTEAQVEAIRERYVAQPIEQSITTGRKRRAS